MANLITDYLTTEAKNQIGLLYEAPKTLLSLSYSTDPNIVEETSVLMDEQNVLESQVTDPNNTGGDMVKTAAFVAAVTYHNQKVSSLANKTGLKFGTQSFLSQYGWWVAGGVGILILLWILTRKSKKE